MRKAEPSSIHKMKYCKWCRAGVAENTCKDDDDDDDHSSLLVQRSIPMNGTLIANLPKVLRFHLYCLPCWEKNEITARNSYLSILKQN